MSRPTEPSIDAPIFIVGNVHSGTTLLRNILARNASLFVSRGETRFFAYLPMIRHRYPDLTDDDTLRAFVVYIVRIICTKKVGLVHFDAGKFADDFLGDCAFTAGQVEAIYHEAKAIRHHRRLFPFVFDRLTALAGKERWLEKTPKHLFHIDDIMDVIPDARIVEMVRDPRDILISRAKRRSEDWIGRFDVEVQAIKRLHGGVDPLWDTLGWKSAVRAGDNGRYKYPRQVMRVRYEDLVSDPQTWVSAVCDFLDLTFRPEMIDVSWYNATARKNAPKGIGTGAVGKWQRELDPAAIAVCQWLSRREINCLGYASVPTTPTMVTKIPIIFAKSGRNLLSRFYKRWQLGGSRFILSLLNNYWKRIGKLTGGTFAR